MRYVCGMRVPTTVILAAAIGAVAMPADAKRLPKPKGPSIDTTRFVLDNGLEVILSPDPTVTTAVVHVWYHVGSKDEVTGKTGFAHLFEHLMFKGSKHVPDGAFDMTLEAAGGWNNGTTNNDRTNYFEQVPVNFLEQALWLEADRLAGLWDAMNQTVLDNQRDVVKNERRQSYENAPYGVANLLVQQALWPAGHGNYNLTIGTMEDLTAASLEDVEAFWRTYYRPSNATLVIVGGIDVAATKALVERYFAWMPKQPKPALRTLDAPVTPMAKPAELTTTDRVQAAKIVIAFRGDAPYTAAATDLELAAQVLGGGKTSRLHRSLVMNQRLATEAGAFYVPQILGGELQLHVIARDGIDPATLRASIEAEIAALRDMPVDQAELDRARRTIEAGKLKSLENIASRAGSIAQWVAYTGDPDYLGEELDHLAKVTPATLQATAKKWLAPTAAVTMTITPDPAQAKGGGGK
jgi:zinc protease